MARLEIPVSGWTCLRTKTQLARRVQTRSGNTGKGRTLVDVRAVSLLAGLGALLLVARSSSLLAGILLLGSLGGSDGGLGGGLLVGGLGGHFDGIRRRKKTKVLELE